jgi:hypothetical protein
MSVYAIRDNFIGSSDMLQPAQTMNDGAVVCRIPMIPTR